MRKLFFILVCVLPMACVQVHYNIAPEFHSDGIINVDGRMDADDPRVTVTVDDVSVDWKELKTLIGKQMANLPKEPKPKKALAPGPAAAPVSLTPESDEAAVPETRARMTHSVQVGAYRQRENAEQQAAQLIGKGYQARLVQIVDSRGRPWYTVRIGDYPSSELARTQADEFTRREKMDTVVRPYGNL